MRKRGFTLVEILVVLAVVGILFSVASRTMFNIEGQKIETTKAEISVFKNAFNSFVTDYGNIIINKNDSAYDTKLEEAVEILNRDYLDYEIEYLDEEEIYEKTVAVLVTKTHKDEWVEPFVIYIDTSDVDGGGGAVSNAGTVYIISGGAKKVMSNSVDYTQFYNDCRNGTLEESGAVIGVVYPTEH